MRELRDMAVRGGTKRSWTKESYDEGFFFGFLSCAGLVILAVGLWRAGAFLFGGI